MALLVWLTKKPLALADLRERRRTLPKVDTRCADIAEMIDDRL